MADKHRCECGGYLTEMGGKVICLACDREDEDAHLVDQVSFSQVGSTYRPIVYNNSRTIGKKDFSILERLCDRVKLKQKNIERAKTFLQRLMQLEGDCWRMGRRGRMLTASAVFMVCNECGIAMRLKDLAEYVDCEKHELGSVYKKAREKLLKDEEQLIRPQETLVRPDAFVKSLMIVAEHLESSDRQKVRNDAQSLAVMAAENGISVGRDPSSIAGAGLFLAMEINDLYPDGEKKGEYRKRACSEAKLSYSTVTERIRELRGALLAKGKTLLGPMYKLTKANITKHGRTILDQLELEREMRLSAQPEDEEVVGEEEEEEGGDCEEGAGEEHFAYDLEDQSHPPSFLKAQKDRLARRAKIEAARVRIARGKAEKEAATERAEAVCIQEQSAANGTEEVRPVADGEETAEDGDGDKGGEKDKLDEESKEIERQLRLGVAEEVLLGGHYASGRASLADSKSASTPHIYEATLSEKDIADESLGEFLKPSALSKRPRSPSNDVEYVGSFQGPPKRVKVEL